MASNALQIPRPQPNQIQWSDRVVPNGGIDESASDHDLAPNKWARGVDVEPLPTGCRARNGKTLVNEIPITPTVLPIPASPIAWYKADTITGLSTGDSITTWEDSSGNGNHLTAQGVTSGGAADAIRPTWRDAGTARATTNLPTVDPGSSDAGAGTVGYFTIDTGVLTLADGWTIALITRDYATSIQTNSFLGINTATESANDRTARGHGSSVSYFTRDGATSKFYTSGYAHTNGNDTEYVVLRGGTAGSSAALDGWHDGTSGTNGDARPSSMDIRYIFAHNIGGSWGAVFGVAVAEIVIYDRALSDVEVASLNTYLQGRIDGTPFVALDLEPGSPAITGILDYRLSDGETEYLLVACGAEVYKEEAGTMTVVSPDAGTFTVDADVHPAMNVGNDIAFISNGIEEPQKFFDRDGVEYWANDGIAAPVDDITAVAASGVGDPELVIVPTGVWAVDYYYWDDLLGIKSNTRYQGEATVEVTLSAGLQTIAISGLPADVARVGDRATHIRISLKSPASGVFRFAGVAEGQVTLGTTTASITIDATTNPPDYDDNEAPIHSISTIGANQRFVAGMADAPWQVRASKINIVGEFYESFPPGNQRNFGKGDGDYVTALAFISPATLIVGMRNSVWALDARRFLTADPVLISKNVGIAGPHALMVTGRTLFFISDSDRTKGMMVWDGAKVTPLTAIDKTFKTYSAGRLKYATCANLCPGDGRFQWWSLMTFSGSSQNRVIVYDYALDAFTVYRHSGNILATAASSGAIAKVKLGGTSGDLYNCDQGSDDAGTPINGSFTSKRFDYGSPDAPKRVRFVRAEGYGSVGSTLNVLFEPDRQGFTSFSGTLAFDGVPGDLLGTGVLGAFVMSSNEIIVSTRTSLVGMCRNAQATFSSAKRWSLRSFSIGVQMTRRR